MFIYFWERDGERERENEHGRSRERETQNPKQAPGFEVDAGLRLTNCKMVAWAEVRHLTDWAIQVPCQYSIKGQEQSWDHPTSRLLQSYSSQNDVVLVKE